MIVEVIDCGSLDDPTNGQVSLDETTVGSIATYTCDPGFMLIGNMERTCQENGEWSGNEPTCEGHLATVTIDSPVVLQKNSFKDLLHIIV